MKIEPCPFCQGAHDWEQCDVVFTPIKDCEHKDPDDGCCHHPRNMTPECHVNACPKLDARVSKAWNIGVDALRLKSVGVEVGGNAEGK